MRLVTSATMQDLDRHTIEVVGISGRILMERAGLAVANRALELARETGCNSALVLCGPGNNGGDGWVAARHLADLGVEVVAVKVGRAVMLPDDAAANLNALRHFPVTIVEAPDAVPRALWLRPWGVVVDALFGTGLSRALTEPFDGVIRAMNALLCPRLAVDLPSGVDSDLGLVLGECVHANVTLTFGTAKIGHFAWPGAGYCGRVEVVPIGIPRSTLISAPGADLLDAECVRHAFPRRDAGSFKNRFGHVLVVGGLAGKAGAALLAARAALRGGSGLATVATEREVAARLEGREPDVMIETILDKAGDCLKIDEATLAAVVSGKTAMILGPGLSTRPGIDALLTRLLGAGLPTVLDADALNVLAAGKNLQTGPECVLTPHPGEAGRLLGITSAEVQADRITAARNLAALTGSVIVLKGAGTVIAAADGRLALNPTGGPALAVGGSGDVLAGVTGALLGRGIPPFQAACAAAYLHGATGDLAGSTLTEHSVLASDLIDLIPRALGALLEKGVVR
jgi:NAD(P)H-hydrate epimerase